jgi:exosortase/archaeosortase family protein
MSAVAVAGRLRRSAATSRAQWLAPRVVVPFVLLVCWPVWRWYVARMSDGSDEPLGLLALVAAALFAPRAGWREALPLMRVGIIGSLLVLLHVSSGFLPALLRAAIAVLALVCALPRDTTRPRLPVFALLLLSLPLIASLQFYLGFPLRAVMTWCCAKLLVLGGMAVEARGTVLHWAGEQVLVDAPCSGIHMLWTTAFVSAVLAAVHRLPARRFVRLAQFSGAAVFVANTARCLALFFLETGLCPRPAWAHEAVGLVAFTGALAACVAFAGRLWTSSAKPPECHPLDGTFCRRRRAALAGIVFAASATLGAVGWSAAHDRQPSADHAAHAVNWPAEFEGRPLSRRPLHPVDERFAVGFPGEIGVFADDERRIVFRRVRQPTRKLHPAADCLRAAGYRVRPLPAIRDRDGALWSALEATAPQNSMRLLVRERIADGAGNAFTDVSAWFWAATWRPQDGPWLAVTVCEEISPR